MQNLLMNIWMQINFEKYHGAGNDFVMIDNRSKHFIPHEETIKKICDRHFGIGADGLILLEMDKASDFSMRYFNADGREGTLCGNGGRCIASFAQKLGVIDSSTVFTAIDGEHQVEILVAGETTSMVKLRMHDVANMLQKSGQWMIDTGSPHLVIPVEDLDDLDVYTEGRKIRYSKLFADEGINVNFIAVSDDHVKIRTYERGVENETLACGTGAVAAAVAVVSGKGNPEPPVNIRARGGNLKVYLTKEENLFTNIWLEGPVSFVYKGEIKI